LQIADEKRGYEKAVAKLVVLHPARWE